MNNLRDASETLILSLLDDLYHEKGELHKDIYDAMYNYLPESETLRFIVKQEIEIRKINALEKIGKNMEMFLNNISNFR